MAAGAGQVRLVLPGADAEADARADAGAAAPSLLAQPGPKENVKAVSPGICKSIYRNALV